MKVYVFGTRGFPLIQGGVEKHCEILYPFLVKRGWTVKVFRRKPYLNRENSSNQFRGVEFRDLWTIKSQNFEAFIHSFLAAVLCIFERPDIVHIHNIGPSLVLPLLKLFRLRTIVTYHSPNYQHDKWNSFARWILMFCEYLVARTADAVIFVSKSQFKMVEAKNKYFIPNGVSIPALSSSTSFISKLGLKPRQYILAVARFTPEKGLHDLINAFKDMKCCYKLVIAGDADHECMYSRQLRDMASRDDRIILTGYISGEPLQQLFSHSRIFVLPSHQEGHPLALLEAMSYGLPVVVSDIPATRELKLASKSYFRCADIEDLRDKLIKALDNAEFSEEVMICYEAFVGIYNWEQIARQVNEVYNKVVINIADTETCDVYDREYN
jgi:glycosyltransferase involved in cell wall biosynthesis